MEIKGFAVYKRTVGVGTELINKDEPIQAQSDYDAIMAAIGGMPGRCAGALYWNREPFRCYADSKDENVFYFAAATFTFPRLEVV